MSRYLLRRTIFAVGVSGVVLALGLLAGAGPAAAAAPSGLAVSPSQTPDPGWCAFLLWLTGRDICASLGSGPGGPADHPSADACASRHPSAAARAPPPPPPTPPPRRLLRRPAPPTPPPPSRAAPDHDHDRRPAAHHGAGSPAESPSATVPVAPPTAAPATTAAAAQALGASAASAAGAVAGGSAPPPATEPPVLPTAPIVTSAPLVLYSNPGAVAADVKVKGPRVVDPEAVPPPYKGNSVVRRVIESTGPIGRRLVIVAGVIVSVLIGIGAYRLEDRTQLIRRIQEWRHVDDL